MLAHVPVSIDSPVAVRASFGVLSIKVAGVRIRSIGLELGFHATIL